VVTEEKVHEIGTRLKHSPQKSLRCLAQKTRVPKLLAWYATETETV